MVERSRRERHAQRRSVFAHDDAFGVAALTPPALLRTDLVEFGLSFRWYCRQRFADDLRRRPPEHSLGTWIPHRDEIVVAQCDDRDRRPVDQAAQTRFTRAKPHLGFL